ncbi:twitch domain-containing radical SAM protein [bacterium]|nr:twitch domain-containing radical SAM protein [bacterium]MDB4128628.1 twitch domain-containing radical SAM protein [bacterium]MDC1257258.1 twitch domain-containing radical SAM protein [bacterium]
MEQVDNYRNSYLDREDLPTCLAPWHALTIKWGGIVIPDIIYRRQLGNIYEQPLDEIFNGRKYRELREAHLRRDPPENCITCQKKEVSGKSRRQYFWDKLDYEVRDNAHKLKKKTFPDIRYLDFTLSNKCNLACIHCNPFVSTGWTKDGKKLNKEAPEYWQQADIGYHGAELESLLANLFVEPLYFRNLQWLALRGGEPLYDETCIAILRWFVEQGQASNISLDISTNATVFRDEFLELFSHFKHVELLVSIEATDDLYGIIRGGDACGWDELQENIEKFYTVENLEMVFAVTVMTSNVFALAEVWDWFRDKHEYRASISMSNVVVNPNYLNIAMMPQELKDLALEKLKDIPNTSIWPEGPYHKGEFDYQTGVQSIRDGLNAEVDPKEQERYWKWFLQYTADLDRLRKTDTLALIPEIKQWVENNT